MISRFLFVTLCLIAPFAAHAGNFAEAGLFDGVNAPMLVGIGVIAILVELMLPTKGALAIIGTILFVLGTISLPNNENEAIRLSWPMVIILNILVLGTLGTVGFITLRNYARKDDGKATEPHIGETANVVEWNDDSKLIDYAGAVWQASSRTNDVFKKGDKVEIVAQDNLTLYVSRLTKGHGEIL